MDLLLFESRRIELRPSVKTRVMKTSNGVFHEVFIILLWATLHTFEASLQTLTQQEINWSTEMVLQYFSPALRINFLWQLPEF